MDLVRKYFPKLRENQLDIFDRMKPLYADWNEKINVISRKDLDNFYERHVLHSLAIAHFAPLKPGQKVLDIGTGGGFPGIPLAVFYPDVQFTLVDSVGKKIQVVRAVAEELGLANVQAKNERAENIRGRFDVVVTRAVAQAGVLVDYCTRFGIQADALVCLKGGDLTDELNALGKLSYREEELSLLYEEPFFETKKLLEIFLR